MGEYSREMDNHKKVTDQTNQHYDALVAAIDANGLKPYADVVSMRTTFGEPIMKRSLLVNGQPHEQWVYRYALISKAKDKVYLYFDGQGKLIRCEKEKIQW